MLALRHKCLHPTNDQPYVRGLGGGRDNSREGLQVVIWPLLPFNNFLADACNCQDAFTHAFISEFQNAEDRKYYLEKDPAHLEFVASLEGVVENVRVVDFEPGVL